MMKAFLAGLLAALVAASVEAKPTIPQERIPPETPSDVRRYLDELYSRDPVTRAMAAVKLGRLGDRAEPAIPFLTAMLGDAVKLEWEVRDPDVANPLEEVKKRILGFYEDQATSPGTEAARSLSRLCTAATEELLAALKDSNAHVRRNAAEALGGIRDRKATEPIVLLLKDAERDVRARAARSLGRLRDPAAAEALVAAMKDPERQVRREVVTALGELKDPRALPALLEAIQDTVEVREAATAALLETRDPRAVEPLIVSLKHRKEDVRRISAKLLAAIGGPRVIKPLILALKDPAADVRFEAASGLRKLSGEDYGADPEKWERWHQLDEAAREIDERLAGDAALTYIAALLNPNWAARAYAAKALGTLNDRRAVVPLRGVLWDKDPTVRVHAATALGAIGDPQAVEPLLAAISDADPEVQEAAEGALRAITGANLGREVSRWQEWWDENHDYAFNRYHEKVARDAADEAAQHPEEEAPADETSGSGGTLALAIILVLVAVFPIAMLIVLRVMRRH